ncbi:MAG: hypothetical protein COB23_09330 [Methylophaga sp.]|nr:MAG: hypothetical protein COB23_09330 [Methylophaga sp.]
MMKVFLGLSVMLIASMSMVAHAGNLKQGKKLYRTHCVACHQAKGQGIPGAFPPLASSDYLMADKQRAISVPLKGLQGKITVNGTDYNGMMPPFAQLSDQDIADIMTYVMGSWGNAGEAVTVDEVAQARAN